MPVDPAPIAALLGKPGDLRHSIAHGNQKQPTVSAATQANTGDLVKWHVDHAVHLQPFLVRLIVLGEGLCGHQGERTTIAEDCSSLLLNLFRKMAMIGDSKLTKSDRQNARAPDGAFRRRASSWSIIAFLIVLRNLVVVSRWTPGPVRSCPFHV